MVPSTGYLNKESRERERERERERVSILSFL